MWHSPGSGSASGTHIFRQILDRDQIEQQQLLGKKSEHPSTVERVSPTISKKKPNLSLQRWIDYLKQSRTLNAIVYNLVVQIAIFITANFRPTLYFWRAINFANFINLLIFIVLQLAYMITSMRYIKDSTRATPGIRRLSFLINSPSTLSAFGLALLSSLTTLAFTLGSVSTCLSCHAGRMIIYSSMYSFLDLMNRQKIHFPAVQLPIETQLRSRAMDAAYMSAKRVVILSVVWYLIPIRWVLESLGLPYYLLLFSPSAQCHSSLLREFLFLLSAFQMFLSWEMSRHVIEAVLTQSILVDPKISISVSLLVKLVQHEKDEYARSLGFLELSDICQLSSSARVSIYSLDDGAYWVDVSKTCIATLERFSKSLYEAVKIYPNRHHLVLRSHELFHCADDIVSITQALSSLVVNSIAEDDIGVVQRSFEAVVGALLASSIAIQDYLAATSDFEERSQVSSSSWKTPAQALAISNAIDRSLYAIVTEFYPYLKDFSFPKEYAVRLQQYIAFDH